MKHNIRGENVAITESIRDYVEKKVEKIEKYFHLPIEATSHTKIKIFQDEQTVEITVPMKQVVLRAEESHADLYAAVDLAVDKLERQVRKYKTKVNRKQRFEDTVYDEWTFSQHQEDNVAEDDSEFHIVKKKHFDVKPMSTEEAILQMNLLGHSFFVFLHAETNQMCTVYARKDNTYGLIEPNSYQ